MKREMCKIKGETLRNEFKKRGLTLSDACNICKFSGSYFSKCIRTGYMPVYVTKILEMEFRISPSSYVITDSQVKQGQSEVIDGLYVMNEVDRTVKAKEELYDIIFRATYEAMKKALSE